MTRLDGLLITGIGGFYYVEADGELIECKARGLHRHGGVTPLAGDKVSITVKRDGYASLDEIYPRKNRLARPPVANLDKLFIVVSTCDPSPSTIIIDKMTAIAADKDIDCTIVFTKTDLKSDDETASVYRRAGYRVITPSSESSGLDEIREEIRGRLCAFAGNSGVGKSTLLNRLLPELNLETDSISKKLGRGRHTTRQVRLYACAGGYIADTPGFAAIDVTGDELIPKENLQFAFKEFEPFIGKCRFTGCAHIADSGCAVCSAVKEGIIPVSRHESYVSMYNAVKDLQAWQIKK